MEKLKTKRNTHRRNATLLIKKVEDFVKDSVNASKKRKVGSLQNGIDRNEGVFEKDGVLETMYEKEEDSVIDKEIDEASTYKQNILIAVSNIDDQLAKLTVNTPSLMRSDSQGRAAASSSISSGTRVKVKLPKLEIRKFSGQIYEWKEFWDAFSSAVHDNYDLADVDKLKYLSGF